MIQGIKRNYLYALFIVSLGLAALINIAIRSLGATTVTHTFKLNANGAGTVKNLAASGYPEGYLTVSGTTPVTKSYTYSTTPIQYQAYPNSGFSFRGWEATPSVKDGIDYTSNPFSVSRVINWTFTAIFKRYTAFSVNISGAKITGVQVNCPTDCHVFYDTGQTDFDRTYTASAVNGYRLIGWDTNTDNIPDARIGYSTYIIDTNTTKSVKAIYAPNQVNHTFSVLGSGKVSGTGINCGLGLSDCSEAINSSFSSRTYTAMAGSFYSFVGWDTNGDGGVDNTASQITLNTYTNYNIKAIFSQNKITHNFSISGSGKVSGTGINCGLGSNDCSETILASTSNRTYTATPGSNYIFSGWDTNGDGGVDNTASQITLNTYTNYNIKAIFTQKTETKTSPLPPSAPKKTSPISGNNSLSVPIEDKVAPTVPTNLVAIYESAKNIVKLSWTVSSDNILVEGYEIERRIKGSSTWEKVGKSLVTEHNDFTFDANQTYQYRVRAYDQKKNYSEFSNIVEVKTGEFVPNVTVEGGGKVFSENKVVNVSFPNRSVAEDLYVLVEQVSRESQKEIILPKNTKIIGDIYIIRAKNAKGEEVSSFKSQILISFSAEDLSANKKTVKIANIKNDNTLELLHSRYNPETDNIETLVNHFSGYVLTAPKSGAWLTFLKLIIWLLVFGGAFYGSYRLWLFYQLKKYQKEHREDYIYRH